MGCIKLTILHPFLQLVHNLLLNLFRHGSYACFMAATGLNIYMDVLFALCKHHNVHRHQKKPDEGKKIGQIHVAADIFPGGQNRNPPSKIHRIIIPPLRAQNKGKPGAFQPPFG